MRIRNIVSLTAEHSFSSLMTYRRIRIMATYTKSRPKTRLDIVIKLLLNNSWQEWLDEDRTFLSVAENAILEGDENDSTEGKSEC